MNNNTPVARFLTALLLLLFAGVLLAAGPVRKPTENNYVPEDSAAAGGTENPLPALTADTDIDALLAPLSDQQARGLLLRSLREQQAELQHSEMGGQSANLIQALQQYAVALAERSDAIDRALDELPSTSARLYDNLTDLQGWPAMRNGLLALAAMLVVGFVVQLLLQRTLGRRLMALLPSEQGGWWLRFGLVALRLLIDLLRIAVFAIAALGLSFLFFQRFDPMRLFATTYLSVILVLWLVWMLSRFLLAPHTGRARLLPLPDHEARHLHHWLMALTAIGAGGFFTLGLLALLGLPEPLQRLFQIGVGSLLTVMLLLLIWSKRRSLANVIGGDGSSKGRHLLAYSWHLLATAYLLGLWGLWSSSVLLTQEEAARLALLSLAVVVALPLLDQLLVFGLRALLRPATTASKAATQRIARLRDSVHRSLRVALLVVVAVLLVSAWWPWFGEVLQTESGGAVLEAAFNIGITLLLSYLAWEAIKTYVDPQLKSDEDEARAPGEALGEASPASRAQTLLPLLRSVALVVLATMLVMVILSSIGVNIGPLLAGAGVIGLAVGFGAQKLVQDVLAGIFFLIDDAFRVGEFIEAGEMRGTVESISLRSMRLRHPRGMVQTVPYGDIPAINNHSRDWLTTCFELRLPNDCDIQTVQAGVSDASQALQKDEQHGQRLLQPLSSQGLHQAEDGSLRLALQFTSRPGREAEIRQTAVEQMIQACAARGLQLPPDILQLDSDDARSKTAKRY